MLVFNHKRCKVNDDGSISFKTPDEWKDAIGVQKEYSDIVFDRNGDVKRKLEKIFGIGHVVVDKAIKQAMNIKENICVVSQNDLTSPVYLLKARDRITNTGESIRFLMFGLTKDSLGWIVLKDWEMIKMLNPIVSKYQLHRKEYKPALTTDRMSIELNEAVKFFIGTQSYSDLPFKVPQIESIAVVCCGEEE